MHNLRLFTSLFTTQDRFVLTEGCLNLITDSECFWLCNLRRERENGYKPQVCCTHGGGGGGFPVLSRSQNLPSCSLMIELIRLGQEDPEVHSPRLKGKVSLPSPWKSQPPTELERRSHSTPGTIRL